MACLVQRLAAWYGAGDLSDVLETFLEKHAAGVDLSGDEQTHANHEVYQRFQSILEGAIVGFCKDEGVTETEFSARCEAEKAEEINDRILSAIVKGASYEAFLALVTSWKAEQAGDGDESDNGKDARVDVVSLCVGASATGTTTCVLLQDTSKRIMICDLDSNSAPVQWAQAAMCQQPLQIAIPQQQFVAVPQLGLQVPGQQPLLQPTQPGMVQFQPVMMRQLPQTPQMSPFVVMPGKVVPAGWAPTQYIALPSPNPTLSFCTPLSSPTESVEAFEDAKANEASDRADKAPQDSNADLTSVPLRTPSQASLGAIGSERAKTASIGEMVPESAPADALKPRMGTCGHNSWDNVRAVRRKIVLRCRVCQAQTCVPIEALAKDPKCEKFAKDLTCPLGHSCPKLHLHHRKQGLNERVLIHGKMVLANVNKNSDHFNHLTEANRRRYLDGSGKLIES